MVWLVSPHRGVVIDVQDGDVHLNKMVVWEIKVNGKWAIYDVSYMRNLSHSWFTSQKVIVQNTRKIECTFTQNHWFNSGEEISFLCCNWIRRMMAVKWLPWQCQSSAEGPPLHPQLWLSGCTLTFALGPAGPWWWSLLKKKNMEPDQKYIKKKCNN